MYVVYGVGAFNEVSIVAMLKAGLDGGSYGAAAAFGASFLFARILEGSLVGILDLGGSILTGIGIGVPAIFLSMGIKAPVENFGLALLTGALLGLAVGGVIVLIRKFTINQGNSTFGADVMMGAGNASGRFLGPLIILSAAGASIPIGIGATLGALGFTFGKTNRWGRNFRRNDFWCNIPSFFIIRKAFCFALSLSQIRISVYIIMLLCYYKCEIIIIFIS